MANKLTPKQDKFAQLIVEGKNASEAYRLAYNASKMSSASVNVTSCRLLQNPKVALRIDELKKPILESLCFTARDVLLGLWKLASYDPRKFFNDDYRLKLISELDDDTAAAIAGINMVSKTTGDKNDGCVVFTKLRFADKGQNLERLGRYFKLFTDRAAVEVECMVCIDDEKSREDDRMAAERLDRELNV